MTPPPHHAPDGGPPAPPDGSTAVREPAGVVEAPTALCPRCVERLLDRVDAEAERDRYRDALLEYGDHGPGCRVSRSHDPGMGHLNALPPHRWPGCTCGYAEVATAAEEAGESATRPACPADRRVALARWAGAVRADCAAAGRDRLHAGVRDSLEGLARSWGSTPTGHWPSPDAAASDGQWGDKTPGGGE